MRIKCSSSCPTSFAAASRRAAQRIVALLVVSIGAWASAYAEPQFGVVEVIVTFAPGENTMEPTVRYRDDYPRLRVVAVMAYDILGATP